MLYVGIDDTDGQSGMCTTYLVNKVLAAVPYSPAELPRLIRLNPTVPWKTRGNGAVAIILDAPNDAASEVLDIVADVVRKNARLDEENTNPGIVVAPSPPNIDFYWKAVREMVTVEEAREAIHEWSADAKGFKNCRGLIGATAAIAWHQDCVDEVTYEIITYRDETKWGTPRKIDWDSVKEMDEKTKCTFNNIDERNKHIAIVPNTPCPILFGIRGEDHEELLEAKDMIKGEEIAGWTMFISNQATDDHLLETKISNIAPYTTPLVKGKVTKAPHTIEGGHVIFSMEDNTGTVDCAAYEPTKEFRDVIRQLAEGDELVAMGSYREDQNTINLEKIILLDSVGTEENPVCSSCGKKMKSAGSGQGYRCKACKTTAESKTSVDGVLKAGAYQTPVCARRHLMRPLKMKYQSILKRYI